MKTSKGRGGSSLPPYRLLVPGIALSWEEMVERLVRDIEKGPKIIEIAVKKKKSDYDKIYKGALIAVFFKKSKLCLVSSNLDIEPIHIRKDVIVSPVLFPDGSFFFKAFVASYTIRP